MNGCEICGGALMLLGQLGSLLHLRCRDCGAAQSVELDEEDL